VFESVLEEVHVLEREAVADIDIEAPPKTVPASIVVPIETSIPAVNEVSYE